MREYFRLQLSNMHRAFAEAPKPVAQHVNPNPNPKTNPNPIPSPSPDPSLALTLTLALTLALSLAPSRCCSMCSTRTSTSTPCTRRTPAHVPRSHQRARHCRAPLLPLPSSRSLSSLQRTGRRYPARSAPWVPPPRDAALVPPPSTPPPSPRASRLHPAPPYPARISVRSRCDLGAISARISVRGRSPRARVPPAFPPWSSRAPRHRPLLTPSVTPHAPLSTPPATPAARAAPSRMCMRDRYLFITPRPARAWPRSYVQARQCAHPPLRARLRSPAPTETRALLPAARRPVPTPGRPSAFSPQQRGMFTRHPSVPRPHLHGARRRLPRPRGRAHR